MIDDRLSDCLSQARECADEHGGLDVPSAFALLRRSYGVGYVDAHREMPVDVADRAVILDAWVVAESASRALAASIAIRARRVASDRKID